VEGGDGEREGKIWGENDFGEENGSVSSISTLVFQTFFFFLKK
jgi:hypothetical protein